MNRFFLLLAALLVTLSFACGDDDDVPAVTLVGRNDGWFVQEINADYRARFEEALAGLSDADLAAADTTRAAVTAVYDERIAAATAVDDCDRDDTLFFLENAQIVNANQGEACPGGGDPSVMDVLNGLFYSADLEVTELRLRREDGTRVATFAVSEISADRWAFSRSVPVMDTLLGDFSYDIEYVLRGR